MLLPTKQVLIKAENSQFLVVGCYLNSAFSIRLSAGPDSLGWR
jgi:hypothetical protein